MRKPYKIAVLDYGMSNMFSIRNALEGLGFEVEITSDYQKIISCDGAILPGVGAFPEAMKNIKELNLDSTIKDFINTGKPFVGICLGFQLLFDRSDEIEDTLGLGIIPGEVLDFSKLGENIRVPHVGWNHIEKRSIISKLKDINYQDIINDKESFYFVHSNFVKPFNDNHIFTETKYAGIKFCSSIIKENIFACQFHPEKSGQKGIKVLSKIFNK